MAEPVHNQTSELLIIGVDSESHEISLESLLLF